MADAPRATAQDVIDVLRSIDASLKQLVTHFGIGTKPAQATSPVMAPGIATDSDLDSKWGDEKIKFNPRDWTADSCIGLTMSQCPAPFLDLLANAHDFFAQKNAGVLTDKGQPKSMFDQRTANRARGWAARLRNGYKPADNVGFPSDATAAPMVSDDEIAF